MNKISKRDSEELGKFLMQLRSKKGISRPEMAIFLAENKKGKRAKGYPGYVGRIERGTTIPGVEAIKNWIEYTEGTYPQLYKALGLAGYIPQTQMPLLKQIKPVLEQFAERIHTFPYPAYIIDYRGSFWVLNHLSTALSVGTSPRELLKEHIGITDLFFNTEFKFRSFVEDIDYAARETIRRFKMINLYRQHELFYRDYLKHMKNRKNISEADYQRFEKIWKEMDTEYLSEKIEFEWGLKREEKTLYFRTQPQLLFQLGNMFNMVIHVPIRDDPKFPDSNWEDTNMYLELYRHAGKTPYKLWDFGDKHAQLLLDTYHANTY